MDILSKIKKNVSEPRIYAVIVKCARGQVLHLGIHFSLEEAYSEAVKQIKTFSEVRKGESVDIDLWNSMPARQVIAQLIDPAAAEELIPMIANEKTTSQDFISKIMDPKNLKEGMFIDIDEEDIPEEVRMLLNMPPELPISRKKTKEKKIPKTKVSDYVEGMKESKNGLMKKLIEDGDIAQVEKLKGLLGSNSRQYVIKEINKKRGVDTGGSQPGDIKL